MNLDNLIIAIKEFRAVAHQVADLTGKSVFYHVLDGVFCYAKYGCSAKQYLQGGFYKLRSFDRKNTMTKGRIEKVNAIFNNKAYKKYLSDKVLFNEKFHDFIHRDWIYTATSDVEKIENFLKKYDKIIAKPINLTQGKGIFIVDNEVPSKEMAQRLVKENLLLEEYICQHPTMQFEGNSVNTIRVFSVIDSRKEVHIIKAALRCGAKDSIVDNYSAGGVCYPINVEKGFIEGYGLCNGKVCSDGMHPGTSILMTGVMIPNWEILVHSVITAAKMIPEVRYVGWDVAITPNGIELVEGNSGPGCSLLEFIGKDREFYKLLMSYK